VAMRMLTRSTRITSAFAAALRRLPKEDRTAIEGFLFCVRAVSEWVTLGLSGDFDPACAVTAPRFLRIEDMGTNEYRCQIRFNLPVARLFSARALVGIAAHELAHVRRAARVGKGWHEQFKSREAAEERAADRLAVRWGFRAEIACMRRERVLRVTPMLDRRGPAIMKRIDQRISRMESGGRLPKEA
jgi:hypothetical protein